MPVIPALPMAPGPAPMDMDAMKWWFGTPLTYRHCGKVRHFAWECLQAYDIHYMMANECEELIEHLLMAEDVPKWVNKWKLNRWGWRIMHVKDVPSLPLLNWFAVLSVNPQNEDTVHVSKSVTVTVNRPDASPKEPPKSPSTRMKHWEV